MNPFSLVRSKTILASFKNSIMEAEGHFQTKVNGNTIYFANSTHQNQFIAYKARIDDLPSTNKS